MIKSFPPELMQPNTATREKLIPFLIPLDVTDTALQTVEDGRSFVHTITTYLGHYHITTKYVHSYP